MSACLHLLTKAAVYFCHSVGPSAFRQVRPVAPVRPSGRARVPPGLAQGCQPARAFVSCHAAFGAGRWDVRRPEPWNPASTWEG